jgi:hypothetical protein
MPPPSPRQVDTAMVGRLGTEPLAALASNGALFNCLFFLFFTALAVICTQAMAAAHARGDAAGVGRGFVQALAAMAAVSSGLVALLTAAPEHVLRVFATSPEVMEDAATYLSIRWAPTLLPPSPSPPPPSPGGGLRRCGEAAAGLRGSVASAASPAARSMLAAREPSRRPPSPTPKTPRALSIPAALFMCVSQAAFRSLLDLRTPLIVVRRRGRIRGASARAGGRVGWWAGALQAACTASPAAAARRAGGRPAPALHRERPAPFLPPPPTL